MPPDHGQGEGADTQDRDNDAGGSEIPGQGMRHGRGAERPIQEFAAMLAFDGGILNLLGAEWTRFHGMSGGVGWAQIT